MGSVGRSLGLLPGKDNSTIQGGQEVVSESKRLRKSAEERSQEALERNKRLMQGLEGQVAGTAPSLAEAQLKSAQDRGLAQQVAAARSQRGGSPAALQRALAQSQAQANQQVAQQAAQARLQEQQAAQQLLARQVAQEQGLSDQLTSGFLGQQFNVGLEQARLRNQQAANESNMLGNIFKGGAGLIGGGSAGLMGVFGGGGKSGKQGFEHGGIVKPEKPKKGGSYKEGGVVGGNDTTGDNVEVNVNSKEMILNMEQQKKLFDMINAGKSESSEEVEPKGYAAILKAQKRLEKKIAELESKKKKG